MSLLNISSANAALTCIVPNFYPQGFEVDDYAANDMFNTDGITNAELVMGADGKLHAGQIFNLFPFSITLSPTSAAGFKIEDWFTYELTTGAKMECNMVLILASIKRKYNLIDGVLVSFSQLPSGARILQPRTASFAFRSIVGSAL